MKRIVVGYDGSDEARRALDRAAELAEAFGSELVVASVLTPVDQLPVGEAVAMPLAPLATPIVDPEAEAERWEQIAEDARSRLAARGLVAEIIRPAGDAAGEIVRVAEERGADLIVVGTHE